MLSTVLFVFTGGTISMRIDPRTATAVPALSGQEILSFLPQIHACVQPEVVDFGRYPGPHIMPQHMAALSDLLNEQLARPEVAGAVVTHGTDTLEETAYLVDLRLAVEKPIAFVGALRNSSEPGWDGPANLLAAARVVRDRATPAGVYVVLNQTVLAAAEAVKTDTQALDSFQSPQWGPLAFVEPDGVFWQRPPAAVRRILGSRIEPRVDLITAHAGADRRFLDCAVDSGARGIVLAGTGRGNVPPPMLPGVQRALEAGIPVVIATRCWRGRVLGSYGYEGSGSDLRARGAMQAGYLSAVHARIKLMVALGQARDAAWLREFMEEAAYAAPLV